MTNQELLELLKKARKTLKKYHVPKDEQTVRLSIDTLETALSEQPTIVRCKDCKNVCMCDASEILPDIPIYAKCTLTDKVHKPDWFCADGERKEGG